MQIRNKILVVCLLTVMLMFTQSIMAAPSCGTTDYSGSSGRLYDMVVFILTICSVVLNLLYVIGSLLAIYSATNIYIKMQTGEDGLTKAIVTLVGACIFLVLATIVMPAFFGFNYGNADSLW